MEKIHLQLPIVYYNFPRAMASAVKRDIEVEMNGDPIRSRDRKKAWEIRIWTGGSTFAKATADRSPVQLASKRILLYVLGKRCFWIDRISTSWPNSPAITGYWG